MRMSERRYRGVATLAGLATVAATCAVVAGSKPYADCRSHWQGCGARGTTTGRECCRAPAQGSLSTTSRIPLAITLRPRDQAGLDAFVASVGNPHSASYRHFLTAGQFESRFAPTAADVAAVKDFLHSSGFTVTAVSGNRQVVDATGTPDQIRAGSKPP